MLVNWLIPLVNLEVGVGEWGADPWHGIPLVLVAIEGGQCSEGTWSLPSGQLVSPEDWSGGRGWG